MKLSYPPSRNKISFNLLYDEYFTTPNIPDTIPNSPAVHKLPTQAKQNICIISITGEEPTTSQGALDGLNCHQSTHGKSKVNISLCRSKSYHIIDLEDICSIFDQVRPVVSRLEFLLQKKRPTSKNIGEDLKSPQRKFCKEVLFVQYDKNKNFILILAPIPVKSPPEGKRFFRSLITPSIK